MEIPSHVHEAHQALQRLAQLSIFEMLANTNTETFFGRVSDPLVGLTLDQLVMMTPQALVERGLLPQDSELLTTRIAALVVDGESNSAGAQCTGGIFSTGGSEDSHGLKQGEPAISSIVVEQMLAEKLAELNRWPQLSVHGDRRLGDFWPPGAVSAPFEQELTFRQLSRMSARALLAKRSVTTEKVQAVCASVGALFERFPAAATPPADAMRSHASASSSSSPTSSARASAGSERTVEDRSYVAMLEAELTLTKKILGAALSALPARTRARVFSGLLTGEEKKPLRTKRRVGGAAAKKASSKAKRVKSTGARRKSRSRRWN